MAYLGAVHRWDVFWADLNPFVGSEQGGEQRPVIVVSNDGVNAHLDVVTVVSAAKLEGKKRTVYPFEVVLPAGTITAQHASIVMPQQIRAISRRCLLAKIGTLEDPDQQASIENRILEHLGIQFEAEELEGF
jgi:mRNA interferase MazF